MLQTRDRYTVAVVGATGAVGREMIAILDERGFPVEELRLYASERSAGRAIQVARRQLTVAALSPEVFEGVDLALFSAGKAVSLEMAPEATQRGCVVIDNSSAWRADPAVPLVVPEVNPDDLAWYENKGIIANPNCSTIQLVVALKPLADAAGLRRVTVATYQAVSGAGQKGIDELSDQVTALLNLREAEPTVHPYQIAFNCIPHIGPFRDDGYTEEEWKLVAESRRILDLPELEIAPTAVRVPVFASHSEVVSVETHEPLTVEEARELLRTAPGVALLDDPAEAAYPMPFYTTGKDEVFVGRIRRDLARDDVLHLFVVSDNLRKGAALNAVQIAELLVERYG